METPDLDEPNAGRVRFGVFELDPTRGQLWRDGRPVRIRPQAAVVLARLLATPGEVVTHDELRVAVWGEGVHVEHEQGLYSLVRHLRRVLRDDAESPRYIRTVPRLGYVFIAPVAVAPETPAPIGSGSSGSRVTRWPMWAAAGVALVVTGALLAWWGGRTFQRDAANGPPRLALAPVRAADPATTAIAGAYTNRLLADLIRVSGSRLEVTAPVATAGDGDRLFGDIGAGLDVDLVVRGRLAGADSGMRLELELARRSDRTVLWADQWNVAADDLLGTSTRAASAIVQAAGIPPAGAVWPTPNPEAREALVRSLVFETRPGLASWREALEWADRAVAADPGSVEALERRAGLLLRHPSGATHRELVRRADDDARRALELAPDSPSALAALTRTSFCLDPDRSLALADRAAVQNPASAWTHGLRAAALQLSGAPDRQIMAAVDRALALDPLALYTGDGIGWLHMNGGRYAAAVAHLERVEVIRAGRTGLGFDLAIIESLVAVGRVEDAARRANEFLTGIDRPSPATDPASVVADYWRWMAEWSDPRWRRFPDTTIGPQFTVRPLVHLGRHDEAVDAILETWEAGFCASTVPLAPIYDPLRGNPRFDRVVAAIRGEAP